MKQPVFDDLAEAPPTIPEAVANEAEDASAWGGAPRFTAEILPDVIGGGGLVRLTIGRWEFDVRVERSERKG